MMPSNSTLSLLFAACLVSLASVLGACSGCDEAPAAGPGEPCETTVDCPQGFVCDGGTCEPFSDVGLLIDATTSCATDETACGSLCCGPGLSCQSGACVRDCGEGLRCGQECCASGESCEDNQCRPRCSGERCGVDLELCCEGGEICFGNGCVAPGADCERTEDCPPGELCEPSLGQCLPRDQISICEYRPPVGTLDPVVGCAWVPDGLPFAGRGDIVATPVVANLTDDNGDGLTNTDDIPNIVFPSFNRANQGCCNVASTIRVLHGECNPDGTMRTIASISEPAVNNDTGLALADLNGDGVPEIMGVTMSNVNTQGTARPQGTVAFKRAADDGSQWEVLWHNETYPRWNVHTRGGATISVADLDGDGAPEVIIGNVVLNGQTGELLWDGVETSGGTGGIGNNAFLGPSSTVADITLDGNLEVIAGNTVYDHQGNVLWTYTFTSSNSTCQGQLPCDGYSAVARFTDGPHPNVVLVREGEVFVLSHEGELVWKMAIPVKSCAGNESGPPTIADFNGDGRPEIGTAGADYYVVAKMECDVDEWEALGCAERGILWKTETRDCSSRATASSVFDFEGDGKAEVVYADEVAFRIYDGSTGAVLFEDNSHQSNTRIEMPVIADVSNDGRAEVLVPSAYSNRGDRPGLRVWKDAHGNWVRTRRIWNQHAYHVTNITEDGRVPPRPERNWENPRLNNFRQNVQPDGLFDAPDLVVSAIEVNQNGCAIEQRVDIKITVANAGALSVPPGIAVDARIILADRVETLTRVVTTERLMPGRSETLELSWPLPQNLIGTNFSIGATVDPDNAYNECNEENNDFVFDDVRCEIQG